MKSFAALLTLLLLNACNLYAEQVIKGEKVIKSSGPVVKLNMTVTQGGKINGTCKKNQSRTIFSNNMISCMETTAVPFLRQMA